MEKVWLPYQFPPFVKNSSTTGHYQLIPCKFFSASSIAFSRKFFSAFVNSVFIKEGSTRGSTEFLKKILKWILQVFAKRS